MKIAWSGPSAPPRLLALLGKRGIAVSPRQAVAHVVATRGEAVPAPPQLPWIWAPPRPVPAERVHEAVLLGAHDAVPVTEPDRLATRLLELAAPEAPPPDASAFVGRSPAAQLVLAHAARAARTSMPVL